MPLLLHFKWFTRMKSIFLDTSRPRQDGPPLCRRQLQSIFMHDNCCIQILQGPINNGSTLVQIMAWHQKGDRPLCEQMSTLTYICVDCDDICTTAHREVSRTWTLSQYKERLSRYKDFCYEDKKVVKPSYLYKGNHKLVRRHLYIETTPPPL